MELIKPQDSTPIRTWIRGQRDSPRRLFDRVVAWFISDRHADYGFAVMRIASGLFLLGWLLANLPIASKIWGPGSAYWQPYREVLGYKFPLNVLQEAGPGLFWAWYVVTIALVIAFVLGWRTRFITPLLFIAYTAINAQNTPIADGGNYFIRIMLIYLILVDVSRRWSLDSRRRAAKKSVETQVGSVLHNIGLCMVVAQVCLVYLEAGLYKVQGTLWQNGTAVYYPLQSEAYGVFPPLADLLTYFALPVFIVTYVSVLAQIAFPFLLFNKITRRVALILMLGMHLGIALLMGLPFFSGIMASADAVLVSGATWVAIVGWLQLTLSKIPLVQKLIPGSSGKAELGESSDDDDSAENDKVAAADSKKKADEKEDSGTLDKARS